MSDVQNQGSNGGPRDKSKTRRHFGDDQKAAIVRRHLADKVPVSDLADEYHVQPSLIYLWIKQVLDQAERAFQQPRGDKRRQTPDPKDRRIAQLEVAVAQRARRGMGTFLNLSGSEGAWKDLRGSSVCRSAPKSFATRCG